MHVLVYYSPGGTNGFGGRGGDLGVKRVGVGVENRVPRGTSYSLVQTFLL